MWNCAIDFNFFGIHANLLFALVYWTQGRNHGVGKGGAQFPGRWIIIGASNRCGGRQMSAGGAEKSQHFHN